MDRYEADIKRARVSLVLNVGVQLLLAIVLLAWSWRSPYASMAWSESAWIIGLACVGICWIYWQDYRHAQLQARYDERKRAMKTQSDFMWGMIRDRNTFNAELTQLYANAAGIDVETAQSHVRDAVDRRRMTHAVEDELETM